MATIDPASLQNLNDIVAPVAVGWWPLAPGWYAVLALLLIVSLWTAWQQIQRWKANRYRRAARQDLKRLQQQLQNSPADPRLASQLPQLLKRTALAAYPRLEVAELSGNRWFNFLNQTTPEPLFPGRLASEMQDMAYSGRVDPRSSADLIEACDRWVRLHRPAHQVTSDEPR